MYLLKMFVDDVLAMMRFPGRGYVFRDGFLYQDVDQQRKDKDEDSDVVTAKLIVEIANNLENESDIQMTFDTPSRNASGKMPVLDLQVWCRDDKLLFMFYEKPMVSSYVIHRDSALSWNVKKISLAGEVCRRYLNTSPCLVDEGMVGDLIDKFRHKLLFSGYSHVEREIIVSEGISRYTNIVKEAESGVRPLYRSSEWQKESRAVQRIVKGRTWSKADSVVFVQATPGELLKKEIEKVMKEAGFKVKVVEKAGRSVKSILQRSDVSPSLMCLDVDCPICLTAGKGKCEVEGVVYHIWCCECKNAGVDSSMYGETGRTGKIRCKEHREALFDIRKQSNLREHCEEYHGGEMVQFGYEVKKTYPGNALSRQLKEALLIDDHVGPRMNDRREWVRPASVRLRAERA